MFKEETGDLFDLGLPAIGHGVNCRGVMGAGIAKIFRSKYPDMYHAYVNLCEQGEVRAGGIVAWKEPDVMIYNLASQISPGADATLWAVASSVRLALMNCAGNGIPALGLPRIGCGIGGLDWPDVKSIMKNAAAQVPSVDLIAVTLPGAE
jgi:O-acetyl-ADP-ribose deacetylase (regulator of RNase III)